MLELPNHNVLGDILQLFVCHVSNEMTIMAICISKEKSAILNNIEIFLETEEHSSLKQLCIQKNCIPRLVLRVLEDAGNNKETQRL